MAKKFILEFTAAEVADEDDIVRADYWLTTAAHYVVSLEFIGFKLCYESSYTGFRDGWRILYEANLVTKTMDEYLNEAKPCGNLIEAIPHAR